MRVGRISEPSTVGLPVTRFQVHLSNLSAGGATGWKGYGLLTVVSVGPGSNVENHGDSNLHEAELEIENAGRTWWKLGKVK